MPLEHLKIEADIGQRTCHMSERLGPGCIGLCQQSYMWEPQSSFLFISQSFELWMTTGISRASRFVRNSFSTSKPDMSGMSKSRKIASGRSSKAMRRPSRPLRASTISTFAGPTAYGRRFRWASCPNRHMYTRSCIRMAL